MGIYFETLFITVEEGVLAILKFYQWISIYLSLVVYLTRLADFIHNFRQQVVPAKLDNGHAALLAQEDERSEEDLTQNNSTATAQQIQ